MTVRADAPAGVSRRLASFEEEAQLAPEDATAHLRADLAAAGGPLVEPIEDAAGDVLVTFVWVGVDGPMSLRAQLPDRPGAWSHAMSRVEGTDVWHLSSTLRRDLRLPYRFVSRDYLSDADLLRTLDHDEVLRLEIDVVERGFADPHNPDRIPPLQGPHDPLPPRENWASVLTLPDAPREPRFYTSGDGPRELTSHLLRSAVFGNERTITVYTPPRSTPAPSEALALLVLFDGEWWLRVAELPVALDNLHAENLIPPTAVVFVHNATRTSRMVELPCEPRLPTMLAEELLPMVRANHGLATGPERSIVGGASYGGLAAAYVAFSRPDLFGNILSCSGSFWWGLANDPSEPFRWGCDGEPEWLTRQYALAERKPLRFWMDVGVLERGQLPYAPGVDQVSVNRHMRTVLQAKGYDVTYYEAPGGHDFATWRLTAPAGLQTLLSKSCMS
jgi:enterochelin esterase family protein